MLVCICGRREERNVKLRNEIVVGWESMIDDEMVIWVLEEACRDGRVQKALQRM